jgi:hypothetical protein
MGGARRHPRAGDLRHDPHPLIRHGVRRDQIILDDVDDAGVGRGHRDLPGRADGERLHAGGELLLAIACGRMGWLLATSVTT